MFVAKWMDKSGVWRVQPDLRGESGVAGVDGMGVFGDLFLDLRDVAGFWRGNTRNRPRHDFLNGAGIAREFFAQEFGSSFGDEEIVLYADAKIFFGNVDA